MIFGIPLEIRSQEYRVGALPFVVKELVDRGHQVYVETRAGEGSAYPDTAYEEAGASIVPSPEKLYGKSEFILKVREPMPVEYELIRPEHTIFCFFYLFSNLEISKSLMGRGCSCYAYELLREKDGTRPILDAIGSIEGQLGVLHGALLLQTHNRGRGVFLGKVAGAVSARVVVLGSGATAVEAADFAARNGGSVSLLVDNSEHLAAVQDKLPESVQTAVIDTEKFLELLTGTDILIIARQPVDRLPEPYITRKTSAQLPKGAVVIDLDVDAGGSVETGKPTTHDNPTFMMDDVIHYCVPSPSGVVPRSASESLSSALTPYLIRVCESGFHELLRRDEIFFSGLAIFEGRITQSRLARELTVTYFDLRQSDI